MNRKIVLVVAVFVLVGAVALVGAAIVAHVRAQRAEERQSEQPPPTYSGEILRAFAMIEVREYRKAADALRSAAKLDPGPDARFDTMLQTIARGGEEGQAFDLAVLAWTEAARLRERQQGPAHWTTVEARVNVARTDTLANLPADKRPLLADALALTRAYAQHAQQGNFREAATAARQALERRAAATGKRHADYFEGLTHLANAHLQLGELDNARPLLEEARDLGEPLGIDNHPLFARVLIALAHVQLQRGDAAAADKHVARGLAILRATVGEEHPFHVEGEQVQAAIRARGGK